MYHRYGILYFTYLLLFYCFSMKTEERNGRATTIITMAEPIRRHVAVGFIRRSSSRRRVANPVRTSPRSRSSRRGYWRATRRLRSIFSAPPETKTSNRVEDGRGGEKYATSDCHNAAVASACDSGRERRHISNRGLGSIFESLRQSSALNRGYTTMALSCNGL